MHNIQGPVFVFLALIPPEDMAKYIVTAFFHHYQFAGDLLVSEEVSI